MLKHFQLSSSSLEFLKIFAIIFMVIDHYGILIAFDEILFRYAGRIVFPLFSLILIYNYLYNTRSKKNYLSRLFLFGVLSQPVYAWVFEYSFGYFKMNIFFTLSIGLAIIYIYEELKKHQEGSNNSRLRSFVEAFVYFSLMFTLIFFIEDYLEYGLLGIMMIVSMYFMLKHKEMPYICLAAALSFLVNFALGLPALIGTGALVLFYIAKHFDFGNLRLNKWFFYLFYPIHLVVLYLLVPYLSTTL